jgi:hypothetical protein
VIWQSSPFAVAQIVSAAIAFLLSLYCWGRRSDRSASYFALLLAAVTIWSLFSGIEAAATSAAAKILFVKLQYIGVVSIGPFWLLFALSFSRREAALARRHRLLLWAIPAITLVLVATNEFHGLIWPSITPSSPEPGAFLIYAQGPAVWLGAVYGFILVAAGTFFVLKTEIKAPRRYKGQGLLVILGVAVPWFTSVLYLTGGGPFPHQDLTPMGFAVFGILVTLSVVRFGFLSLAPIAYETLFAGMTDGVIALDTEGRIADINDAARRIVGLPKDVVGRGLDEVFAAWPHYLEQFREVTKLQTEIPTGTAEDPGWVDLRITPLYGEQGRLRGRLITLRDITEQKLAEEARRMSEGRFRLLVENAPEAIFVQTEGKFAFVNPAGCRLFGADSTEALLGKPVMDRFHPDFRALVAERIQTLNLERKGVPRIEEVYLKLDGTPVDVEVAAVPLVYGDKDGALVFVRDITERKRAEAALRASDEEKGLLLKEIHHRVKNNMQVISSMLSLQSREAKDPEIIEMFRDVQTRIRSMALVHEKLYQSKDLARVDFASYLQSLIVHLFHAYRVDPDRVRYELKAEQASLDINTAIPIGLIVSELVSNALKYAFPEGRNGIIRIELEPAPGDRLILGVADDGVGLPAGLDVRNTESLGLQIVNMLVDQLGGRLEVDRKAGTGFRMDFQEPKRQRPA